MEDTDEAATDLDVADEKPIMEGFENLIGSHWNTCLLLSHDFVEADSISPWIGFRCTAD